MKQAVLICLSMLMLCGCSTSQKQNPSDETAIETSNQAKIDGEIPPYVKEPREILPLPENEEISDDPMMFVDTLMDNYEVKHIEAIDTSFEFLEMEVNHLEDGYVFSAIDSHEFETRDALFNQSLDSFFNTPENQYAVLVRFKSNDIDRLNFKLDSHFGRIMLGFTDGRYPTIDLHGDTYGDLMLEEDWNNYVYTSGEWAYVFLTITNHGQKTCYLWPEDDPGNFNFLVSFAGEEGSGSPGFSIGLNDKGEAVTISDIWLFSYERIKI